MGISGRLRARVAMALSDDALSLGTLADGVGEAHETKTLITTADGLRWTANEIAWSVDHAAEFVRSRITKGDQCWSSFPTARNWSSGASRSAGRVASPFR